MAERLKYLFEKLIKKFGIQKQTFDCIDIFSVPIYMINGKNGNLKYRRFLKNI